MQIVRQETPATNITRAIRPQIIMASVFCIYATIYGMSLGHSAVLLPELQSVNSSIPIDKDVGSWIASVYAIVGPLGCILGGFSIDVWGRKKPSIIGSIILTLGWLLIVCAQNADTIVIGRILEGISRNEMAISVPIIMDELLDPKLRGLIVCGALAFISVGLIVISSLGTFLDWRKASAVATVLSSVSILLMLMLVESPIWLIRNKQNKRAENVLRYIWGPGKELQVRRELSDLKLKLHLQDVPESPSIRQKLSLWKKIIIQPHVLKPFLILHFFNAIQAFCGLNIFTYYSIDMLSEIKNGIEVLEDNVTTIVISIVRTVTVLITCFLVLYIGRRKLCIASGTFSSVSAFSLGIILFARNIRGEPLISQIMESYITFSLVIIFSMSMSFGFAIFPALMLGETQASCIRGFASGYIFAMNELILGIVLKNYPLLMNTLQIHGMFLMFAISCVVCTIFLYLFLPETRGLALQEIEEYFRQSNILWITRKSILKPNEVSEDFGDDSSRKFLDTYL